MAVQETQRRERKQKGNRNSFFLPNCLGVPRCPIKFSTTESFQPKPVGRANLQCTQGLICVGFTGWIILVCTTCSQWCCPHWIMTCTGFSLMAGKQHDTRMLNRYHPSVTSQLAHVSSAEREVTSTLCRDPKHESFPHNYVGIEPGLFFFLIYVFYSHLGTF